MLLNIVKGDLAGFATRVITGRPGSSISRLPSRKYITGPASVYFRSKCLFQILNIFLKQRLPKNIIDGRIMINEAHKRKRVGQTRFVTSLAFVIQENVISGYSDTTW